jgi:hypothetical protein
MPVELKQIIIIITTTTTTTTTTTFMWIIYNYIPKTMFLGYIVLQLFCIYNLCYLSYYYYYYYY